MDDNKQQLPNQYPMQAKPPAGPPPAYYPAQPHVQNQGGYPAAAQPVTLSGYQPYPAFHSQQQSSSNVVVVNQPSVTPAPTVVVPVAPKPPDYLVLSLVVLALCFFHGNWLTFFCLIPAVIFSIASQNHAAEGNYSSAKSMGQAALGCNIAAFVSYVILFVLGVIALAVYYGVFYGTINRISGGCYDVYDPHSNQYVQVCA